MNSIESLTTFFGWCTVLGCGLLMVSFFMLTAMRGWVSGIHARMFSVQAQDLSMLYLKFMAYMKVAIVIFAFIPWLALKIMA